MVAARHLLAFALLALPSFAQQARLAVSAFDEKTGEPIANLTTANFVVKDGDTQLRVDAVEHPQEVLDLMLVVDTSMVGQAIRPLVMPMIDTAAEDDQTALVGYDQSATLLQDFTSSKDLLRKGMLGARYGGNPRGIDALFAVLDGGFDFASGRRVAVLLSAGAEGSSRTAPGISTRWRVAAACRSFASTPRARTRGL
ncbi:MAG: hypothetical protein R2748_06310 [Bryobacterales bacterium]